MMVTQGNALIVHKSPMEHDFLSCFLNITGMGYFMMTKGMNCPRQSFLLLNEAGQEAF
jgi:hypothetical protein